VGRCWRRWRWRLPSLTRCYILFETNGNGGNKRVFNNIVCVQCHHRGRHSRLVLFMLHRSLHGKHTLVAAIILLFSSSTSYYAHVIGTVISVIVGRPSTPPVDYVTQSNNILICNIIISSHPRAHIIAFHQTIWTNARTSSDV